MGFGLILMNNSIVKFSNDWFSPSERVTMNSILTVAVYSGVIGGFVLP